MFSEFAYKYHAYQLTKSELTSAKNELKSKVQMKYLLLHLYIFFVIVLMVMLYDRLTVPMMLSPLAIFFISISAIHCSFSKAMTTIKNSIIYPYYSLTFNSIESELIRVEKRLDRLFERQIGRGGVRYISPKIPSYNDVISSHYSESIMSNYLEELYRENNKRIDMKGYIKAIAKENEAVFMSKDLSVSLVKTNERT